jgi:citrate lyase beta subunit
MDAIRSLLFVPADSERKIAKALDCAADALILDLEDSVTPDRKPAAREICRTALAAGSKGPKLFVRINALDTPEAAADLAAVMQGGPFGIVVPKCQSARDLLRLDDMLTVLEAREGLPAGQTLVLPIVTETGRAMLGFGSYAETRVPRLFGMMWGGEDLCADLGVEPRGDRARLCTALSACTVLLPVRRGGDRLSRDRCGVYRHPRRAWARGRGDRRRAQRLRRQGGHPSQPGGDHQPVLHADRR